MYTMCGVHNMFHQLFFVIVVPAAAVTVGTTTLSSRVVSVHLSVCVFFLFTLTDASVRIPARSTTLVLLVPGSAAASEADCVGLSVSLTKALSTLGLNCI